MILPAWYLVGSVWTERTSLTIYLTPTCQKGVLPGDCFGVQYIYFPQYAIITGTYDSNNGSLNVVSIQFNGLSSIERHWANSTVNGSFHFDGANPYWESFPEPIGSGPQVVSIEVLTYQSTVITIQISYTHLVLE